MCTSLIYRDANGVPYVGRTIELDVGEPYFLAYVPAAEQFRSEVPGQDAAEYEGKHAFVGVAAPGALPEPGKPFDPTILKGSEGFNDVGLTFSLNAYPTKAGEDEVEFSRSPIEASDLGTWLLSQFATVEEAKAGLEEQPVNLTRIPLVGNIPFPFHIHVSDKSGASIVIQWDDGEMNVYDNPVGVLTNAPEFPWHLTNLGNWTHLNNVDVSSAAFGSSTVNQPDSGIATALLPSDNTAVGRFIRAVYYTTFAEKASEPDQAVIALARIMDNFDRPRGATVDLPTEGGAGVKFQGTGGDSEGPATEFTAVTILSDTNQGRFYLRSYEAFNFSMVDIGRMSSADGPKLLPVAKLDPLGGDVTEALLSA